MTDVRNILLIGATGHQGQAIIHHLVEKGYNLRAGSRDLSQGEVRGFKHHGIEVVRLDMDDSDTVRRAAEGIDVAFFLTTPEHGPESESKQGVATIEALQDAGVRHVVYSSAAHVDEGTGVPFFDSKRPVEEALRATGVSHTIVGPVFFRENLLMPGIRESLEKGVLRLPLPADRPLQTISVEEIGAFLAYVIEDCHRFDGQRIDLASDENTPAEMAELLGKASGRPVRFEKVPLEDAGTMMPLFRWLEQGGFHVDIERLQRDHPDVPWRSFRAWAHEENLGMVARAAAPA